MSSNNINSANSVYKKQDNTTYGANNTVSNAIDNHPIAGMVPSPDRTPNMFLVAIPTYGALYGATELANKYMTGEYKNTMLGKLAAAGDWIANTKIYQATFHKAFVGLDKAWTFTKEKIVPKSDILKSLFNPVEPVWGIAKDQLTGLGAFCGNDCKAIIERHMEQRVFEAIGKQEKNAARVILKNANAEVLSKIGLSIDKLKGRSLQEATELINEAVLKSDFGKTLEDFKKYSEAHGSKESLEFFKDIFEEANRKGIDFVMDKLQAIKLPKFLQRKIPASQQANKIACVLGENAKSGLGKGLSKSPIYLLESLGNTAFGGKFALLIGTLFISMGLSEALKKKKGNRLSTAAEDLSGWPAFLIAMPLAAMSVYAPAGLKYIGVSKEKVAEFRKGLKALNERNKAGGFATKADHKKAVKELKGLLKEEGSLIKRIWHAPFRFLGKALSVGLDNVHTWNNPKTKNSIFKKFSIKKLPNGLKRFGGGISRAALILMVATPIFTKPITKLSHICFGKPIDEEAEAEKLAAQGQQSEMVAANTALAQQQYAQQLSKQQEQQKLQPLAEKFEPKPLLDRLGKGNNSPIASTQLGHSNKKKRSYIPSPIAEPQNEPDNNIAVTTSLQKELKETQRVVGAVDKYLNG